MVAGREDDVDRLEAPPASRFTSPALAVAVVVLGALAWLGLAGHPRHHPDTARRVDRPPTPVVPAPAPAPTRTQPPRGSVFLEHLDNCTRVDRSHHLTVAVRV